MDVVNKKFKYAGPALFFLLIAAAIFLLFYGLGDRYLWQDEAQTALIAKTVIDRGLPYGTDGLNFFSQEAGLEYGRDYIWKWHPWLQFYVLAFFIKIFGAGNFIFRLPFALFGLASVIMVFIMMRRLTGSFQKAVFSMAAVVFSTAFLLLSRQCRYYGPEMFFSLASVFCYLDYMQNRTKPALALLFISMTCLFHTLYLNYFILLAVFALHWLLFVKARHKAAAVTLLITLLVNLPAVFIVYNIDYSRANWNMFSVGRSAGSLLAYSAYVFKYLFPWFAAAVAAAVLLAGLKKNRKFYFPGEPVLILALLSVVTLFLFPVFSPTPFLRNLACIVIPLALLGGLLCQRLYENSRFLGIAMLLAIILNSPVLKFINEIKGGWEEATESLVRYIGVYSKKGDTVLITYPDLPLKLYTGLKVYGGLTGESLEGIKKPDFVIKRAEFGSRLELSTLDYIHNKLDFNDYDSQKLPAADRFWENREDILSHDFGTDDKLQRVVVYRLKNR